MKNSIYPINKGINKSIVFQGLQAQYIWYLAAGILILMILFSVLYIMGINTYCCLLLILSAGGLYVHQLYRWSHRYGAHGMMKLLAQKKIPPVLKSYGRQLFYFTKTSKHAA